MTDTDTYNAAWERVRDFIEAWESLRDKGDLIYGVNFETLTVSDLKTLMEPPEPCLFDYDYCRG